VRRLIHGVILHGEQYLAPERRLEPTTYYGPTSGVGLALQHLMPEQPPQAGRDRARHRDARRVGQDRRRAALLRDQSPGDRSRQARVHLTSPRAAAARRRCWATRGSPSSARSRRTSISCHRRLLERLDPDAPAHEGGDGGLPAPPQPRRRARLPRHQPLPQPRRRWCSSSPSRTDCPRCWCRRGRGLDFSRTDWVLVARNPKLLEHEALAKARAEIEPIPGLRPWTDDFNNLFRILK